MIRVYSDRIVKDDVPKMFKSLENSKSLQVSDLVFQNQNQNQNLYDPFYNGYY